MGAELRVEAAGRQIKAELLERFQAIVRQGGGLADTLEQHVLATVSWAAALNDNDFDLLFAADGDHVTPDSWLAAFGVTAWL